MRSFVGTPTLLRLALRRDRLRLAIWVVALAGVVAVFTSVIGELYPDVASRRQLGVTVAASPAFSAMLGPLLDPLTVGGLVAWRLSFFPMVLVPLMALQTVARHTRAEEEQGRLELVGSAVVGHRAPLTAALLLAMGASLVVGALVTLALVAQGQDVAGSVALGAVHAGTGAMFAGIAAITAQLTVTASGATGLAGGLLGLAFLLRAAADGAGESGPTWLRWLSPTGWVTQARPYADERWWVVALMTVVVGVAVALAFWLVGRRDLGAGLLPTRRGPAEGPARLASPLALAWRLHRGALLWWSVGLLVSGIVYGVVAESVTDLLDTIPGAEDLLRRLGGAEVLADAFVATTMGILALIVSVFTLSTVLHLRSEEVGERAEPLLATRVTRARWVASHLVVAVVGTTWLLAVAGAAEGLAHGLRVGDLGQAPRLAAAGLAQVPAVLVLAGIAVALFGLLPRFVAAAWGALVASLLVGQLGPVLQLDQWALNLSPFTHAPRVPAEEVTAAPVLALLAVATAFTVAGFAGFRRRDLGR